MIRSGTFSGILLIFIRAVANLEAALAAGAIFLVLQEVVRAEAASHRVARRLLPAQSKTNRLQQRLPTARAP
jgi:hypothetical protein